MGGEGESGCNIPTDNQNTKRESRKWETFSLPDF